MSAWANDPDSVKVNPHTFVSGWRTVIPMRPLSVGETLDAALRLVRFNPAPFIVFPIIVNVLASAIEVLAMALFLNGPVDLVVVTDPTRSAINASLNGTLGLLIILGLIGGISYLIVLIAGVRVTIASVQGKKLTIGETFRMATNQIGRIFLRLIGLVVITFLLTSGLVLGFALIGYLLLSGESGSVMRLLLFLAIVFVTLFVFMYRLMCTVPAMIAEDIGPGAALVRSWKLTKGQLGYFILLYLALGAIVFFFSVAMAIILGLVTGMGLNSGGSMPSTIVSSLVTSLAASVIITPVLTATTNLVYVNMRMKRENFHQRPEFHVPTDIGANAEHSPGSASTAPAAQQAPSSQAPDNPPSSAGSYGQYGGYGQFDAEPWDGRPQWYSGDDDKTAY
ncbi:glycerophosphoryl diester phosphodiesterase membrane domain-containing protein [Trueperella bialowiezensis]|uniref:Membrane domain of glycerophosphoryl diester phosphodiesterase n=1 Tax=Trueperella bialowiezensis TaxID=312285 RepID=A0A448PD87_9ACTO|nr:glycerophosphoryl diester phosphodiesterase membrane domain-containing protein [Trueperella bialowiezensis]VEI12892.1 Membrane domain of glycerophosphoryl diester phosphodiesterase [Trueperella bialowiezensis]